ncbi:MAG: hypothetical protein IT423_12720 [Pirellulaceae bacterium]|nr:hypothetical protein [Pirellulaceae bacterium]
MNDDTRELLDDILRRWHNWSAGYRAIADVGSSPMFRQAKSGRQYESQYEIAEHQIDDDAMAAVDFHVYELEPMHRTALQINARNLATGRAVWRSERLPADSAERAIVLAGARAALLVRLIDAGIL